MAPRVEPTLEDTPFARVPTWSWGVALGVALAAGAFAPVVLSPLVGPLMERSEPVAVMCVVSTTLCILATLWLSRLHRATHFFGLCLIFAVLNAPLSLWPLIAEEPDLGAQLGVALFVTVVGSVFSLPLGIAYALAMAAPRRWLNARQPAQHDGAQRLEKATAWSSSVAIIAWFTCPCELGDSPRVAAGAALGLALWGLVVRVSQRRMLARVAAGQDARFEIAERSDAPAAALDAAARGPVLIARVVRSEGPFRDVVTRAPLLALGNVRRTVADGTGALLLAAIVMTAVLIGPTRVSLDPSADWSGSCR